MHIVLLSEHGDPLIGGATHLTKKIASTIASLGYRVTFIVPNSGSGSDETYQHSENFTIIKVRAIVPIDDRFQFRRGKRMDYAKSVDRFLKSYAEKETIHVIQVLSGTYLLRHLDVPHFQQRGITVVAGLLNVPPQECSLSWKGDAFISYSKDELKKVFLKEINRQRIIHHPYDAYTVESESVKRSLAAYVPPSKIHYIPLGTDETEPVISIKHINGAKQLLTAGGINPSKNQHIIPRIANLLREKRLNFHWYIIGPDRNPRYKAFLEEEIKKWKVENIITLISGLSKKELMHYYSNTDIYVQTSIEEGFCMTALDAVVYGIPLVGINTGAIAEFIAKGKGELVQNNIDAFAEAISTIFHNPQHYTYTKDEILPIIAFYNWERIGNEYVGLYDRIRAAQIAIN